MIALEGLERAGGELERPVFRELPQEVLDQLRQILAPLGERGHDQGNHVEAVEEVFSKGLLLSSPMMLSVLNGSAMSCSRIFDLSREALSFWRLLKAKKAVSRQVSNFSFCEGLSKYP